MLNFLLYKLVQWLSITLPLPISYKIAVFFADLHRFLSPKDRAAISDNLKTIFPEIDGKLIQVYTKTIFRNFAKYLVDFFRFECINKNYIEKNVAVHNLEIINQAFTKKKGVIVTTAHIANWELAGITMPLLGYPLACVALNHRNERINSLFIRQRQIKGVEVIPLGKAAIKCIQALRKNKLLALVGDRDFAQSGLSINFFGKPTFIPKGPALLSLRTGAPLVVGIIVRQNNNKFRFTYEGPIEINPSGDQEKDTKLLTEKYIAVIEQYIRKYPDQWLMFRRFWESVDMLSCE